jgi:hypothetical protein
MMHYDRSFRFFDFSLLQFRAMSQPSSPFRSLLAAKLESDRKPRVFVVDDIADNVQFLSVRLRTKGFEVVSAANGVDALAQMVEMLATGLLPDIILLDVQMPEMDGFEEPKLCHDSGAFSHVADGDRRCARRIRGWCGGLYRKAFPSLRASNPRPYSLRAEVLTRSLAKKQ